MDAGFFAPLFTLVALFAFLGICAWAFDRNRDADFAAAAELPFNDPEAEAERRRALLLGR